MSSIFSSVLTAFLVAVVVSTAANTCTTVYLHRALSHRALTLRPSISLVFRAVLWLSTGIKPKEWVAVHRKHHAYTDIEGDPHSPVLLGWKTVQTKNVALYRASVLDPSTIDRYAKDLPDDRWDTLFFGHNKTGLLSGVAILMIVLGPWTGLLAAFLHANIYLGRSMPWAIILDAARMTIAPPISSGWPFSLWVRVCTTIIMLPHRPHDYLTSGVK